MTATTLPFRTGWGEVRPVAVTHGRSRLQDLRDQHVAAQAAEINADPLSIERRRHAARADRLARQIRDLSA